MKAKKSPKRPAFAGKCLHPYKGGHAPSKWADEPLTPIAGGSLAALEIKLAALKTAP